MKKVAIALVVFGTMVSIQSCKKDTCGECHYDKDGDEVELGEKCGDELEDLEKNGYALGGETYEVHCGEGHH